MRLGAAAKVEEEEDEDEGEEEGGGNGEGIHGPGARKERGVRRDGRVFLSERARREDL